MELANEWFKWYFTSLTIIYHIIYFAFKVGCTIVLYDGSPFKPTPNALFELIDQHKITVFGTSAKYIQTLQAAKATPAASNSLKSMHTLMSTGSPLPSESFDWIYKMVKKDVLVGSITGIYVIRLFLLNCT